LALLGYLDNFTDGLRRQSFSADCLVSGKVGSYSRNIHRKLLI